MINRRALMTVLGLIAGLASFLPMNGAKAQDSVSIMELGVAGPLGDMPLGPEDAKVTIYEYSSFTCSHCADFHNKTYPELKKLYVDTGKVRYIRREIGFDQLAIGASVLARCSDKSKFHAVSDLLFKMQDKWAFTATPADNLRAIMRQTGMSDEQFDACLKNKDIIDGIQSVVNRAKTVLKIEATPTFFINGKRVVGAYPLEEFKKQIDEALAAAK
ncbi:DsbA family protein [Microvirga sp. W0021]|uniref:DsbA family protein n=1 Tax=Hohaiivirga grylli TaxID=3133970 RepID=A0ABV0BHC4_9HYPH